MNDHPVFLRLRISELEEQIRRLQQELDSLKRDPLLDLVPPDWTPDSSKAEQNISRHEHRRQPYLKKIPMPSDRYKRN